MNQPAFPTKINTEYFSNPSTIYDTGMTLRDYFAAKAMQSFISNFLAKELDEVDPHGWMEGLAMDAYSMADAMMKERDAQA
jgi:hypothetical protein